MPRLQTAEANWRSVPRKEVELCFRLPRQSISLPDADLIEAETLS